MIELPSPEKIDKTSGRVLIAFLAEIARDVATRERQNQDACVSAYGNDEWDETRAREHHGLCAIAAIFEGWLKEALEAEKKKERINPRLADAADLARTVLKNEQVSLRLRFEKEKLKPEEEVDGAQQPAA